MNKSITNILQALVLQLLSITLVTIGMDQKPQSTIQTVEVKIDPTNNTAFYVSPPMRDKLSQYFNLRGVLPNEPFIRGIISYSISEEEIKAAKKELLGNNFSEEKANQVLSQIRQQQENPVYLPLTHLRNKKNGDTITCVENMKLTYCNTKECKFDDYIDTCMQEFQINPGVFVMNHAQIPGMQQQGTIALPSGQGSFGHGRNGWFTSTKSNRFRPE